MGSARAATPKVVGLFAGIGGFELGLQRAGFHTQLLCEWWEPAQAVLRQRFPGSEIVGDVRQVEELPGTDVVTAGFPCTDLSQAGQTRGIRGEASGLVAEVFRLLRSHDVPTLMLENVRNMLVLDGGSAIRFLVEQLEALGYRWAYRLVDSRFAGVPQRRQRVIFVASKAVDPAGVLLSDDSGEPLESGRRDDAFGFYWTEGLRGLGWARDAVPTLKGGSTVGIPSPPGIWFPAAEQGHRIVRPALHHAERLQGFPIGWTDVALPLAGSRAAGARWKMLGNAVTVGVSEWVGRRLLSPGRGPSYSQELLTLGRWPNAAFGYGGRVSAVEASMWPTREPPLHLADVVSPLEAEPLSLRATSGFYSRTQRSSLRFEAAFLADIAEHMNRLSLSEVA